MHDTTETKSPSEPQNEDAYIPTVMQPHDESLFLLNVDLSNNPHLSELLGTSIPPTCQSIDTPEACVHPQTSTPSSDGHGQPSTQSTQLQQPQQLLQG
jgi:hypothetical protein